MIMRRARRRDVSDARLLRGEARPLEGLPLTIKDSFATAGLTTSCGAAELIDHRPEDDAVAVARLRAAGAIILAKSNVPRLTGDFQTYSGLYGVTVHPWDDARSPGGSSGGAAAAVAAGFCAFDLASDQGGSIRWPAHACGLFGLKPSWGQIPLFGHIPPLPLMRLKNRPIWRWPDRSPARPAISNSRCLSPPARSMRAARHFSQAP